MSFNPQFDIRTVLETYFNALDSGNFDILTDCFTEDAIFEFNADERIVADGRDAILIQLRSFARPFASNHALSNTVINLDGDVANATTFAIVHFVTAGEGGRVLVRGLRYDDQIAFVDGAWRIAKRRHMPLWQYQTTSESPRVN